MAKAQTSTINTTIGTAIAAGRFMFDPDFSGASNDLDDEGRIDCVKIFVGSIGNAVCVGVRKWQLYRRTSISKNSQVSRRIFIFKRGQDALTVPQKWLVRRQTIAKATLIHDNIREILRAAPAEEVRRVWVV